MDLHKTVHIHRTRKWFDPLPDVTDAGASALLRFMHSSNRSQPQLDFLRYSLSTLVHVARHEELQSCLLSPECIHVLVEQLQLYRDKEVPICWSCNKPPCTRVWLMHYTAACLVFELCEIVTQHPASTIKKMLYLRASKCSVGRSGVCVWS